MPSYYTDLYTTQDMSTTGTRQRDVADTIRHLFPGSNFMPLVSSGKVAIPEGIKKEKNMLGKRRVHSPKFEAFTQSPMAIEFTVTSLSGTTLTLSSTSGLAGKYSLINTANNSVCNIDSVDSTTVCTITSYSSATFTASANDKLLCLAPHYEEKSSSPNILFYEPTNLYNLTFIFRNPVGISDTALQSQHYGGDRYMHIKNINGLETMRKCSNNLMFDRKPASSAESNTSGAGHSFRSCDGIFHWAQTTTNFHGSMTLESFMDMPLDMHESVSHDDPKIMFCGDKVWSVILGWENDGTIKLESGSYKQFGVESRKVLTCKGPVEVMILDCYNRGDFSKQALICNPERIDYVFLRNRDMKLRPNIHGNSVDGKEDEIYGEISICPDDGGYSIHKLINCVA